MKTLRIDGEVFDLSQVCKALRETTDNVELVINSPGGDVFEGLQAVRAIENCKFDVTAKIEVMAASIAAVIALACDKLIIGKNDLMMLHNCWTFTSGNKEQLQKDIDAMTAIDKVLHNIIGEHCSDKDLEGQIDSGDVWLLGEEVVEKFDHAELAPDAAEKKLAAVASLASLVKRARGAETEEERKRKKKNVPPQPEPEPDDNGGDDNGGDDNGGDDNGGDDNGGDDNGGDDNGGDDNGGDDNGGDDNGGDDNGGDNNDDPDTPESQDNPGGDTPPASGDGDTPAADNGGGGGGGDAPEAPSGYIVPKKLQALLDEAAALE